MIEIAAIDHIVLRTVDKSAMLTFYQQVLGCRIERELVTEGLTQLRAGSALIDIVCMEGELGRAGGKAPNNSHKQVDHFCLTIKPQPMEQLIDYLHSHKITMGEIAQRYGAEGFGISVYIQDPEGNVVELKNAVN